MTEPPPATPEEVAALGRRIDEWLARVRQANPVVHSVERLDDGSRRWIVRLRGEEKEAWAIWLTLGQRTLRFETFVLPAPERNHAEFFRHLLRRNHQLTGIHFEIGDEDAVFLAGSLPLPALDDAALDRVLGTMWAAVEQCFRPALRLGFIAGPPPI